MILNINNFSKVINNHFIFEKNPIMAVGVSGGPDSMALVLLLNEWLKTAKGKLIALIVNHNLRKNSKAEAILVKNYLEKKKINSKILNVKKALIHKRSMNEARYNRYNLLINYCNKNKILNLFLAHHKDDNLETFLTRKISGSDFEGLGSMQVTALRNKIIISRPLLYFSKKEILKYNSKNNIYFVNDPSNQIYKYTRPFIRNYINNLSVKNYYEIENDFRTIKEYSPKYKRMIDEILIKNTVGISKNRIQIKNKNFQELDSLIAEKITKKIYHFFYDNNVFLRSKKIQIFLSELKNPNFKLFNIRGMIVKKFKDSLFFSKKAN